MNSATESVLGCLLFQPFHLFALSNYPGKYLNLVFEERVLLEVEYLLLNFVGPFLLWKSDNIKETVFWATFSPNSYWKL